MFRGVQIACQAPLQRGEIRNFKRNGLDLGDFHINLLFATEVTENTEDD
jgi:hypothetical protein